MADARSPLSLWLDRRTGRRPSLASKWRRKAQRDRIIAGACVAISECGPRPAITAILSRSKAGKEGFYEVFDNVEECVRASLSHSLDEFFRSVDAGEDCLDWVAGHRPEAGVIAWGFAIDPDAIEAAIDRAAGLLPIDGTPAIGVVSGIYSVVGARLRAGRSLDSATVRILRDFAGRYGG